MASMSERNHDLENNTFQLINSVKTGLLLKDTFSLILPSHTINQND